MIDNPYCDLGPKFFNDIPTYTGKKWFSYYIKLTGPFGIWAGNWGRWR